MIAPVFLNVLFNVFCIDSVSTNVTTYCYYEQVHPSEEAQTKYITEYEVTNETSDTLYTWYNSLNEEDETRDHNIYRYFFKRRESFYLFMLLTDNVVWDGILIIDYTFLKRLRPGERFKYIIISKDNYVKEEYLNRVITVVKSKNIYDNLKLNLDDPQYNDFLFINSSIAIDL